MRIGDNHDIALEQGADAAGRGERHDIRGHAPSPRSNHEAMHGQILAVADQPDPNAIDRDSFAKVLGDLIKDKNAEAVRMLNLDIEQLKYQCPTTGMLPLQWAISSNAYEVLDVLLGLSDESVTSLRCRGQTVLQKACERSGDAKALVCIRNSIRGDSKKFKRPEEVYRDSKKRLGADPRRILDDIYKDVLPRKKPFGLF